MSGLRAAIEHAINCHSAEGGSDTPDFILAEYLVGALAAFDQAVRARERWYGRGVPPAQGDGPVPPVPPTDPHEGCPPEMAPPRLPDPPGPYDVCANCGSWHYTHRTGDTARGCPGWVRLLDPPRRVGW